MIRGYEGTGRAVWVEGGEPGEISVIVKENVKHLSVSELEREDIKSVVCRGKVLLVWEGEDQMKV